MSSRLRWSPLQMNNRSVRGEARIREKAMTRSRSHRLDQYRVRCANPHRRRSPRLIFAFVFLFVLGTRPAGAHHSHSMFDTSREVTVTGTVTVFSYRNPHVFLHIDV